MVTTKAEETLQEAGKKIGLDVYKAVSGNIEGLTAKGKLAGINSNELSKQITDWVQQQVRDHWVDRQEVKRTQFPY